MRLLFALFILISSTHSFACGGDYYYWMNFYSLFNQENISNNQFKPFLRDSDSRFYNLDSDYYYESESDLISNSGNIKLWQELLAGWDNASIFKAVYSPKQFDWQSKNGKLLKRAKLYIEYANHCSHSLSYREKMNSWDYEEIIDQNQINNAVKTLEKGIELFNLETNPQLKARYGYQIIRILHYSKKWKDAIAFFDARIKGKFPKNEIYYYTLDQVAGCYYSTKNYNKAAYLFTKVVNHSEDRKKSAYNSFDFCVNKDADGSSLAKSIEDKKDLQFMKGIRDFSDEILHIKKFVNLDPNDSRIEVLFARAINKLESQILGKNFGLNESAIPNLKDDNNLAELISIADNQTKFAKLSNPDFWWLSHSYLSFLNGNFSEAKISLNQVDKYKTQKSKFAAIYEVFSWDDITKENEIYLNEVLTKHPLTENDYEIENHFQYIILDFVAHKYYKHNQIAKAFLVHNYIDQATDINSLRLLQDLEDFYNLPNKSEFELKLLSKVGIERNYMDYVNQLKGIYYLHNFDSNMALEFFNMSNDIDKSTSISNAIFSNNIIECFNCEEFEVMEDKVYMADVFKFIKPQLNLKELATVLVDLEIMTQDETKWKAKLANYLLGNYYFNLSNTGYFRGALTNRYRSHNSFFGYYSDYTTGEMAIDKNIGYNLENITYYSKNYFGMSLVAANYYKQTIALSDDKELNARCLYLIAKCELNQLYNGNENIKTYSYDINEYYDIKLPVSEAFHQLKYNYKDTKFHDRIIKECSYFRFYSERF